jgi:hypothetical protein
LAGSLGYAIGAGIMLAITPNMNFLVWIIGMVVGIALAIVVILFNVQKWVIIAATALMGAGVIVGTFLFMLGRLPAADVVANPVRSVLQDSPFWLIIFIVVAVLGFLIQFATSRSWQIESYDRWDDMNDMNSSAVPPV